MLYRHLVAVGTTAGYVVQGVKTLLLYFQNQFPLLILLFHCFKIMLPLKLVNLFIAWISQTKL